MTERSERGKRYDIFMKSKEWKETRAKVYAKYSQTWNNVPENRFICFDCGKNYPLKWARFHHILYKRSLFKNAWERTKYIRILCNSCHWKIHKEKIEKRKEDDRKKELIKMSKIIVEKGKLIEIIKRNIIEKNEKSLTAIMLELEPYRIKESCEVR